MLGAETIRAVLQKLVPEAEFVTRPRVSTLPYSGPQKLTRLPPRSAVVAFSAAEVYATAELIRRQRGGTAVVLGALSPRTRNAQVALFERSEEHTSELQSLMRISYAVFCLIKKKSINNY